MEVTKALAALQPLYGKDNVEIDREALIAAVETELPEVENYLDLSTGEVLTIVGTVLDEEVEMVALDEIALDNRRLAERVRADRDRYALIPAIEPEAGFSWMQEFSASVADAPLRERLQDTLRDCEDNCFQSFRRALVDAPESERERWFAFRNEKISEFLDGWLEGRMKDEL